MDNFNLYEIMTAKHIAIICARSFAHAEEIAIDELGAVLSILLCDRAITKNLSHGLWYYSNK